MNEKIYKTMGGTGVLNLVLGICLMVVSVGIGIVMIISGSRLLKKKGDITF